VKMARGYMIAGAAAALCLSSSAIGENNVEWKWSRFELAEKAYSMKVPCSPRNIASASNKPLNIAGQLMQPGSQLVCQKGGFLFASGIALASEGELAEGQTAYDAVLEMVSGSTREGLQISLDPVGGRRAIQSREVDDKTTAQTTIVEFSDRKLIMILAGGPFDDQPSDVDIGPMIDRHLTSLKVSKK